MSPPMSIEDMMKATNQGPPKIEDLMASSGQVPTTGAKAGAFASGLGEVGKAVGSQVLEGAKTLGVAGMEPSLEHFGDVGSMILNQLKNIPAGLKQTGSDIYGAASAAMSPAGPGDIAGAKSAGRAVGDIGMMAVGSAIPGFFKGEPGEMPPEVIGKPPKTPSAAPGATTPPTDWLAVSRGQDLPPTDVTSTRDFARDAVKNAPPKQPVSLTVPGQQDPAVINKTLSSPAVAQQVMQAVSKGRGGEPNVVDPAAQTATQTTQPEALASQGAGPATPMGGQETPTKGPFNLGDRPLTEFENQQMRQFIDEHPGKGYLPESELRNQFYDMLSNRSGFVHSGVLPGYLLYRLAETLARKGLQSQDIGGILGRNAAAVGTAAGFGGFGADTSSGIGAR